MISERNRLALITGGSRGIGAATARLFGQRGWQVALTYRTGREQAEQVVSDIEASGGAASAHRCDTRDEAEIGALFATLDAMDSSLGALINNAGITGPRTRLAELTAKTLRDVTDVNLVGCILCAREAVRRMSTETGGAGGSIVNLSSTATALGSPNQWIHYAATKGAIDVFTRGLAHEVAEEGIRVNAVSPGLTLTDPAQADAIAARLEELRHEIPMARAGTAEEVAEAIYWLCSDAASYVTGAVLSAAGGR
ncbi:MAG: SDR family oxidoreductase [Minwuiales bacterium]|nr:SDR family oxidoreductase [Minwuiales bacterium]